MLGNYTDAVIFRKKKFYVMNFKTKKQKIRNWWASFAVKAVDYVTSHQINSWRLVRGQASSQANLTVCLLAKHQVCAQSFNWVYHPLLDQVFYLVHLQAYIPLITLQYCVGDGVFKKMIYFWLLADYSNLFLDQLFHSSAVFNVYHLYIIRFVCLQIRLTIFWYVHFEPIT